MKTHITLEERITYVVRKDDYSLDIDDVHPQQLKWIASATEEFEKAQRFLQEVYNKQYTEMFLKDE